MVAFTKFSKKILPLGNVLQTTCMETKSKDAFFEEIYLLNLSHHHRSETNFSIPTKTLISKLCYKVFLYHEFHIKNPFIIQKTLFEMMLVFRSVQWVISKVKTLSWFAYQSDPVVVNWGYWNKNILSRTCKRQLKMTFKLNKQQILFFQYSCILGIYINNWVRLSLGKASKLETHSS